MFKGIKIKYCIIAVLGSVFLAFGLYNVHALAGVTEGGVVGLNLLLEHWFSISPAITNFVANAICYLLGWKLLGRKFIIYSAVATVSFSLSYAIIEQFPPLWPQLAGMPLVAALLGAIFVGMGDVQHSEGYYELTDGWSVQVRDEHYENANLIELTFPLTNHGDTVVLERILPEHMVEGTVMQFYVTHATVVVEVDDQVIYEYGQQLYEENRMLGYGFHFADIPYGSAGKTLKVSLCVSENDACTWGD